MSQSSSSSSSPRSLFASGFNHTPLTHLQAQAASQASKFPARRLRRRQRRLPLHTISSTSPSPPTTSISILRSMPATFFSEVGGFIVASHLSAWMGGNSGVSSRSGSAAPPPRARASTFTPPSPTPPQEQEGPGHQETSTEVSTAAKQDTRRSRHIERFISTSSVERAEAATSSLPRTTWAREGGDERRSDERLPSTSPSVQSMSTTQSLTLPPPPSL